LLGTTEALNGEHAPELGELRHLLTCLERKLAEFEHALDEEPRTIDRDRAAYLELLARYVRMALARMMDVLFEGAFAHPGVEAVRRWVRREAAGALIKSGERLRRVQAGRYAWAAADGRQLRQHYLVAIRRGLDLLGTPAGTEPDPLRPWVRAEENQAVVADR